jgi:hypothetical protein
MTQLAIFLSSGKLSSFIKNEDLHEISQEVPAKVPIIDEDIFKNADEDIFEDADEDIFEDAISVEPPDYIPINGSNPETASHISDPIPDPGPKPSYKDGIITFLKKAQPSVNNILKKAQPSVKNILKNTTKISKNIVSNFQKNDINLVLGSAASVYSLLYNPTLSNTHSALQYATGVYNRLQSMA